MSCFENIKEELLFDFSLNMPRILISGKTTVIDNVKGIELLQPEQIIIKFGKKHIAMLGRELLIKELGDERMLIVGEIDRMEFY